MKKIKLSRGPEIDMQKCMKNSGNNRFELIIAAAARAREIAQKSKNEKQYDSQSPIITALLELQNK